MHIGLDVGFKFMADTFRKWCGESSINFNTAAPKYQEQNRLVERYCCRMVRLANAPLLYVRYKT